MAAILIGLFGIATLHYCESTGAPHHAEWAREYGMPEPSWGMWLGGLLTTLLGVGMAGFQFGVGRRRP